MAETQNITVNPNFLSEPGDVITEQILITDSEGNTIDIRNFTMGVVLYEDVFSNVLTGTITIVDAANLIGTIPFKGAEYLTISFRTPSFKEKISKSFFITKLDNRFFNATDKQAVYVLHFMSIEGQRDNNQAVFNKFSEPTSNIVRKVYDKYLKTERFIRGAGTTPAVFTSGLPSHLTVVPSGWHPLRLINYATTRSYKAGTKAADFMFFESNKGFYFVSISELVNQQVSKNEIFTEFVYFPGAATVQVTGNTNYKYTNPDFTTQFRNVKNMNFLTQYDVLAGQDYGYYASKLFQLDMTTKIKKEISFDYVDKFSSYSHLHKNPPFPSNTLRSPEAYRTAMIKQLKFHNSAKDPLQEKWALERNSLMFEWSKNLRIEIEVAGRTDIEVGRVVNFLYPKNVEKEVTMIGEDALDPYISGLYLVTAIRHEFSLNKHKMFVELAKDSLKKSLG